MIEAITSRRIQIEITQGKNRILCVGQQLTYLGTPPLNEQV